MEREFEPVIWSEPTSDEQVACYNEDENLIMFDLKRFLTENIAVRFNSSSMAEKFFSQLKKSYPTIANGFGSSPNISAKWHTYDNREGTFSLSYYHTKQLEWCYDSWYKNHWGCHIIDAEELIYYGCPDYGEFNIDCSAMASLFY